MDVVLGELRKRQTTSKQDNLELELRFQDVTYELFSTILSALAKDYKWEIEKTVDYRIPHNSGERRHNIIRQIEYRGDKKISDHYRSKEIISSTRVVHSILDYNLTLSLEKDTNSVPSKADAITRVKLRFRFKIEDSPWQIHLSIVRQLSGESASSLVQTTVNKMFKQGEITPQNYVNKLNLAENALNYKFEIEIELMNSTVSIKSDDITKISNKVFDIIGKDKIEDIQYQNEVYFIASYVENVPERLEKFKKDYGIKNLAPPVIPLNKSIYKQIYPPINYFVSDKADGIHAFVSIHDQKCFVIADKYYEFQPPAATKDSLSRQSVTILDCELIYGKDYIESKQRDESKQQIKNKQQNEIPFRLLVFDAIIIDGKFIGDKGFEIRQQYFKDGCKLVSAFGINTIPKRFERINVSDPKHIEEQIRKVTQSFVEDSFVASNKATNPVSDNFTDNKIVNITSDKETKNIQSEALSNKNALKKEDLNKESSSITTLSNKVVASNESVNEIVRGTVTYDIDGVIMVKPGDDYKNTIIYKHKSLKDNTIDFLAMKCPDSVLGIKPFIPQSGKQLYFLFNGITYELFSKLGMNFCPGYQQIFELMFPEIKKSVEIRKKHPDARIHVPNLFPIQFCPSDSPMAYLYYHPTDHKISSIHENIVELRCKGPCNAAGGIDQFVDWELVRVRGDRLIELAKKRYFGNFFKVAEMTWINYIDPFPIEQLWKGPIGGYFTGPKSGIYVPQTAFTSYVKSKRIENYAKYNLVIDLGGGQGQDLRRYIMNQIQNLIIIDKDHSALAELDRRKYDIIESIRGDKEIRRVETSVQIMYADLNVNYKSTIDRIHRNFPHTQVKKAGAVVCNLAIHYFMETMEHLRNFTSLVQLLTDSTISITCMLGDRVNSLFTEYKIDEGKSWDSYDGEIKKYSIKKLYTGDKLTKIGQKIGIMLPFSSGEYYEENLVNTDTLVQEFKIRGFELKLIKPFDEYKENFKRDNKNMYYQLTEDDFKYLSLYGEIVFEKI